MLRAQSVLERRNVKLQFFDILCHLIAKEEFD